MICSLYNITANSKKKLKLIQVKTYANQGNKSKHIEDFSQIEKLVNESIDSNFIEAENRCRKIEPTNIRKQTIQKVIEEHIKMASARLI